MHIQYIAPARGQLVAVAERIASNGSCETYRVIVYEGEKTIALFDGVAFRVHILGHPFSLSSRNFSYSRMTIEKTAVTVVAGLMALAARTAPKAKGQDEISLLCSQQRRKRNSLWQ